VKKLGAPKGPSPWRVVLVGLVVLCLNSCSLIDLLGNMEPTITPSGDSTLYTVKTVVDGDTIILTNGEKVRYIGINTPERDQLFYQEATDYHQQLVLGKQVRLEYDTAKTDQYGRILAYVFVGDTFVNLEMIKAGWALYYSDPDNHRYDELLEKTLIRAQKDQAGMWKESSISIEITDIQYDPPGEDAKNLNGEWVELKNNSSKAISMKGFILKDEAKNEFVFPDFQLPDSSSVKIYTGLGKNNRDSLYWDSKDPIWNNAGDTVYLYDKSYQLISSKGW